jgi:hypothetical protein
MRRLANAANKATTPSFKTFFHRLLPLSAVLMSLRLSKKFEVLYLYRNGDGAPEMV